MRPEDAPRIDPNLVGGKLKYDKDRKHITSQRPPATAQSQQWRELAERVREHPCQCCAEGGYRSNCSCDEQHLMAALIAAADAYDQKERDCQVFIDSNGALTTECLELRAHNAALRELLAMARYELTSVREYLMNGKWTVSLSPDETIRHTTAAIDAALKDKPHEAKS